MIRPRELRVAASRLGISSLMVADYRDGKLNRYLPAELTGLVRRAIRTHAADLLLVIEPAQAEPGRADPDAVVVARAVCSAAEQTGVPALARMARATRSGWHVDLGSGARPPARSSDPPGRARQPGRSLARDAAPHRPAGRPRAATLAGPAAPHARFRVTERARLLAPPNPWCG